MKATPRIPIPDNFAERAKELDRRNLRAFYGVSRHTIDRWIVSTGVQPYKAPVYNRRPIPDDFRAAAQVMHKTKLIEHYKTSDDVMSRWIRESGIRPANYVPRPMLLARMGHAHKVSVNTVRHTSIYDEAADALRRERFPVNRCNDRGGYDPEGRFWRVGWSTVTPDELLTRAAKYQRRAA